jgi:hypothetical protein
MASALLALAMLAASVHGHGAAAVHAFGRDASRTAAVVQDMNATMAATLRPDATCTVSGRDLDAARGRVYSDMTAFQVDARALARTAVPSRYAPAYRAAMLAVLDAITAATILESGVLAACADGLAYPQGLAQVRSYMHGADAAARTAVQLFRKETRR